MVLRTSKKLLSFALCLSILMSVFISAPLTASADDKLTPGEAFVNIALNEVGNGEYSATHTKYNDWYGAYTAWCCIFVSWCADQMDVRCGTNMYGTIFPKTATCQVSLQWYRDRGRYHTRTSGYIPKPGDLIYFDWSGTNTRSGHIGIVKSVTGSKVNQVSGNFGNKVAEYSYQLNDTDIMGYASPDYAAAYNGDIDSGVIGKPATPDDNMQEYSAVGVNTDNLNVRKGAGVNYTRLGTLPSGSSINICGKFSNGWYKIQYGSGAGYVCGDYVTVKAQQEETTAPSTTVPTTVTTISTTKPTTTTTTQAAFDVTDFEAQGKTTANLNIRSGPSTKYSSIVIAPNGSKLSIVGKVSGSPDWYKVVYGNYSGYASSTYIKIVENTTSTTVAPTTTTTTTTTTTKPTTTATTTTTTKPATTVTTTSPDNDAFQATGVTTANLNVRTDYSTSYKSLVVAPKGSTLYITGKVSGSPVWYKVTYGNYNGYVSSQYVQLKTVTTTTTNPTTTTTTTITTTTTTTTTTAPTTTTTVPATRLLHSRTIPNVTAQQQITSTFVQGQAQAMQESQQSRRAKP